MPIYARYNNVTMQATVLRVCDQCGREEVQRLAPWDDSFIAEIRYRGSFKLSGPWICEPCTDICKASETVRHTIELLAVALF